MFINGPTSSTPRPGGVDESWEDSMESPFDRLDRRLRDELRIGDGGYASSDAPTPSLPSGYDLPGLRGDSTYGDVSTGTVEPADLGRDPLSAQGSRIESGDTPKAKQRNPFTNATGSNAKANSWDGITDLRSTPLNAKFAKPKTKPNANPASRPPTLTELSLDDSDDDIKLNMSPPVTMTFNLPPRAQAVLKAGRTPVKSSSKPSAKDGEARMILDDLMEEMERGYEPSPRMPTPEGLGRYSVVPGEIGGQRRMLFNGNGEGGGDETYHPPRKSMANTSFGSDGVLNSQPQEEVYNDDEDSFDVDDSYDSPAPSGPSHFTSAQVDDSYMSMSPDTSEAGMIFGGPAQVHGVGRTGFNLMKPDEMMTYHGGRLEDAAGRDVADSPTHAVVRGLGR